MFRVSSLAVAMIMVGTLLVPRARADEFSVASLQGSYAYTVSFLPNNLPHAMNLNQQETDSTCTMHGVLTFDGAGHVTMAAREWDFPMQHALVSSHRYQVTTDICRAEGGVGTYAVRAEGFGDISLHWPEPFCGNLLWGMLVEPDEEMHFIIADGRLQLHAVEHVTMPATAATYYLQPSYKAVLSEPGVAVPQSSPCSETSARVELRPLPALPR